MLKAGRTNLADGVADVLFGADVRGVTRSVLQRTRYGKYFPYRAFICRQAAFSRRC